MVRLTVVHPQAPLVIGSCGVHPDQQYEAFEGVLDWLELQGVSVERLEASAIGPLLERSPEIARIWQDGGVASLPLVVAGEHVLSHGRFPTRHELAHLAGPHFGECSLDALRHLAGLAAATALGRDDERARERARAEQAGMDPDRLDTVEEEARRFAVSYGARS